MAGGGLVAAVKIIKSTKRHRHRRQAAPRRTDRAADRLNDRTTISSVSLSLYTVVVSYSSTSLDYCLIYELYEVKVSDDDGSEEIESSKWRSKSESSQFQCWPRSGSAT
jgi:hypothetical protein